MTLNILQFGATGQVAREALARAQGRGLAIRALSRAEVDLTDTDAVTRAIDEADAELVFNAAAYTAVDRAESEPELAFAINGAAPGAMARACEVRGLPLIHISTDYVFDGARSGAWREDDPTDPQGVYGASKLAGERAITEAGSRALTLRTSWVFSPHGANFVKTMLRLGRERDEVRVVDDQLGRPTCAGDIAEAVLHAAPRLARGEEGCAGLFHFAGAGETSWFGFAQAIFELSDLATKPRVSPIPTSAYPTPARRPANSVLDTGKFERVFGAPVRPWRTGLQETLYALSRGE